MDTLRPKRIVALLGVLAGMTLGAPADLASVNNGRIQKCRPRPGADPDFLVGKPWKGVW